MILELTEFVRDQATSHLDYEHLKWGGPHSDQREDAA